MWAILLILILAVIGGVVWYYTRESEASEPIIVSGGDMTSTPPAGPDVDLADGVPITPLNQQYEEGSVDWDKQERVPVWAQWYTVPGGKAKSWKECQTAAKQLGAKTWGYRKVDKSCFVYNDNNYVMRMRNPALVDAASKSNHQVGCTEPGMRLGEGCEDWTKGDRVRGAGGSTSREPLQPIEQGISLDACIAKGKAQGIDAIFYHTQNYPNAQYAATCYKINDTSNLTGYTGSPEDTLHVQACTNPSKKIINGCM